MPLFLELLLRHNVGMKRVLLVVNPVAGRGRAVIIAPRLLKELAALGMTATTIATTEEVNNNALDQAIIDSDVVIAMGGDGTLNRVARAILLCPQRDDKPCLLYTSPSPRD